jgi:hypothetical protein
MYSTETLVLAFRTDSIVSAMYSAPLKTGVMTEIFGLLIMSQIYPIYME